MIWACGRMFICLASKQASSQWVRQAWIYMNLDIFSPGQATARKENPNKRIAATLSVDSAPLSGTDTQTRHSANFENTSHTTTCLAKTIDFVNLNRQFVCLCFEFISVCCGCLWALSCESIDNDCDSLTVVEWTRSSEWSTPIVHTRNQPFP